MADRSFGRVRQASTRLDTPPCSASHHPNSAIALVHDHWKPYYKLTGVLHALCNNAHHLRELKALVDIEKEDWARKMQRLLR
jgi:hypothetical protein